MTLDTGPCFEEVDIGTELPELVKELSIPQLARYAAVCWDFQPEHYDSGTAQSHGFKAAYADGPMVTAFLGQVMTNWMGASGVLKKLTVTYRVMMFPGDRLTCSGKVTGKSVEAGGSEVECDVWAENQNAERVVYGKAFAELPHLKS